MDHLLDRTFPLVSDPDLKVINAYRMRHTMGSMTVGNMGYAIIDRQGQLRNLEVDGAFGKHADVILQSLKRLP